MARGRHQGEQEAHRLLLALHARQARIEAMQFGAIILGFGITVMLTMAAVMLVARRRTPIGPPEALRKAP